MIFSSNLYIIDGGRRSTPGKTLKDLMRLDKLGKRFVQMCADVFPFKKSAGSELLYLVCEKIHSVVHAATEIMRWGNLINCSGEAAESTHKINVKGPGANLNHRETDGCTLMNHARRKDTARALGVAIQGNHDKCFNLFELFLIAH